MRRGKWIDLDWADVPSVQSRQFDIAWTGTAYANDTCASRVAALDGLKKLGLKRGWKIGLLGRRITFEHFRKLLFSTKIFLGPWGHGEWSTKDEFAALAGAVVVKPLAAYMEATIPIYSPGVTCIDVNPDWSDLEAAVSPYLTNHTMLAEMQRNAYDAAARFRMYRPATKHPNVVAKFAGMVANARDLLRKPWPSGTSPETTREIAYLEAAQLETYKQGMPNSTTPKAKHR